MGAPETRPRHARIENGDLLVLRGVNVNPGDRLEDMVSLRLWLGPSGLFSVSVRGVAAIDDTAAALRAGEVPADGLAIALFLAQRLAHRIRDAVLDMESAAHDIEEELLADSAVDDLDRLQDQVRSVRRQALWLKRHLGPQRMALADFRTAAAAQMPADHHFDLAELVNETQRSAEAVQTLAEHGGLLQDQVDAARASAMRRTSYVLGLVAAIFLPLNLLAAVFGANVGGVPWAGQSWGFAALSVLSFAIAVAGTWLLRWRRWL